LSARNNRSVAHWLAAVLLAVASLASVGPHPVFAQTSPAPRRAPEFVRTGLNQQRIDLNAYRGKVVLLNFWATWCAPCELEMPRFVDWQNKYGPRGLQIVGISMDDDPALARAAYRKLRLNYPVAMGDAKLGELYGGVLGLPVTFLIDAHGQVRARFEGETSLNKIETQLQSLLPRP
jgi:peroxiredoxin